MAILAPSLVALRNEVNAIWPSRDKGSDGWIGDAAHAASKSEHNPDSKGIVRALDIDKDGVDTNRIINSLIGDKRVHYVIFNGLIYSRRNAFKPVKYTGSNPHKTHIHVSIRNSTSESASAAELEYAASNTDSWLSKQPQYKYDIKALQASLNKIFPAYRSVTNGWTGGGKLLAVDGVYGNATRAWVSEFQRRTGLSVSGELTAQTAVKLRAYGVKL